MSKVWVDYTNHRGRRAWREIALYGECGFVTRGYPPKAQAEDRKLIPCMEVWMVDKSAKRSLACTSIHGFAYQDSAPDSLEEIADVKLAEKWSGDPIDGGFDIYAGLDLGNEVSNALDDTIALHNLDLSASLLLYLKQAVRAKLFELLSRVDVRAMKPLAPTPVEKDALSQISRLRQDVQLISKMLVDAAETQTGLVSGVSSMGAVRHGQHDDIAAARFRTMCDMIEGVRDRVDAVLGEVSPPQEPPVEGQERRVTATELRDGLARQLEELVVHGPGGPDMAHRVDGLKYLIGLQQQQAEREQDTFPSPDSEEPSITVHDGELAEMAARPIEVSVVEPGTILRERLAVLDFKLDKLLANVNDARVPPVFRQEIDRLDKQIAEFKDKGGADFKGLTAQFGTTALDRRNVLAQLRSANVARNRTWDNGHDLTPIFFACALAGEVGELCNKVKKLERERLNLVGSRTTSEELEQEIGDVLIYLDLLASKLGIDVWGSTRKAFNDKSKELGFDVTI